MNRVRKGQKYNSGTPDPSIRTGGVGVSPTRGGLEGGALKTLGKRNDSGIRLWEHIYATPQDL